MRYWFTDEQFVWDEGTAFDGFRWHSTSANNIDKDPCVAYLIDMSAWLPNYPMLEQHYGFDIPCSVPLAFCCEKQTKGKFI